MAGGADRCSDALVCVGENKASPTCVGVTASSFIPAIFTLFCMMEHDVISIIFTVHFHVFL